MGSAERLAGVFCPVVTPFNRDLSPNPHKLIRQCEWLLSQGVGLAVFGTNSEANSLSVAEKIELLVRLVEAGIDPARLMPGTGCCALTDTLQLTAKAVELGCAGCLMLPPFFYKDVSDDGLYAAFSEVIQRVASNDLNIYLYHIPPIAQVGISLDLIERLIRDYPGTIAGIKDSSGDWENTRAMLERGWDEFQVFAGSENFLLQTMRAGGAGCISATANINPAAIHRLYASWQGAEAESMQRDLDTIRTIVQDYPMIPALKAVVAHYGNDPDWKTVRPPLVALDAAQKSELLDRLLANEFDMPGMTSPAG